MSFLIFIFILALLVLIHEFGHFIIAKKNGVLVEEFGFGLPPRLFGIKKGETLYSINLIPLGGFVKLYGEEYHEILENKKIKNPKQKAFIYKKPYQKFLIIIGGVIMNLFLGISIFYYLLFSNNFKSDLIPLMTQKADFKFGSQEKKVIIVGVKKNSPAEKAKIKFQDVVLRYKINQDNWKEINSASQFIQIIKMIKNNDIYFEFENNQNGEKKIIKVKPIFDKSLNRYVIGVSLADGVILKYDKPIEKIFSGFLHSYNLIDYNFKVLADLFSQAYKEKDVSSVSQAFSGPVGIFAVIQDTVSSSGQKLVNNLLNLIALLSLSLAIMNVLPFPALDGGRMIFVFYEWIFKKIPNKTVEQYINLIGFLILISLGILISINDIAKFFR